MIPNYHGVRQVSIPNLENNYGDGQNVLEVDADAFIFLTLIKNGILSPLEGFNTYEETISIMDNSRLPSGVPWSMPFLLPVSEDEIRKIRPGDELILKHNGRAIARMNFEGTFSLDPEKYCMKVFGTRDQTHPGVRKFFMRGSTFVQGKITRISSENSVFGYKQPDPESLRRLFHTRNYKTVTAFQTRNPPHRGHEFLHKFSLLSTDALFINPVIGPKKEGDFSDNEIFESYKTYVEHYLPKERTLLEPLIYTMQYAGPREALIHMIMRKNLGCTHFIIGRDHAGVGSFYKPYAARDYLVQLGDLGITPIFLREAYYCNSCMEITNEDICPHDESKKVHFSGTKIRGIFSDQRVPAPHEMRKEVYNCIISLRSSVMNGNEMVQQA